jgi:hypothetical protein
MRALRVATLLLATLSLLLGTVAAALATTTDDEPVDDYSIRAVAGKLEVHQLPGGTFDVQDRVFQYRDYPVAGSTHHVSDPRLNGYLISQWNWDVQSSGDRPVPAWGSILINGVDGSWSGQFTGIRASDFEPIGIRAVLFGDGEYEGLCATLDITAFELARGDTWSLAGIVHPMEMTG